MPPRRVTGTFGASAAAQADAVGGGNMGHFSATGFRVIGFGTSRDECLFKSESAAVLPIN